MSNYVVQAAPADDGSALSESDEESDSTATSDFSDLEGKKLEDLRKYFLK